MTTPEKRQLLIPSKEKDRGCVGPRYSVITGGFILGARIANEFVNTGEIKPANILAHAASAAVGTLAAEGILYLNRNRQQQNQEKINPPPEEKKEI